MPPKGWKKAPRLKPDDYVLCNCAGCGRELWGAAMAFGDNPDGSDSRLPPGVQMLAGRVGGRPYCMACIHPQRDQGVPRELDVFPSPTFDGRRPEDCR